MGGSFWIRRFLLIFVMAFVVLAATQLVQGRTLDDSLTHALLWAAVSTTVFTGSRIYQSRKGRHCALCRDTPEMRESGGGSAA